MYTCHNKGVGVTVQPVLLFITNGPPAPEHHYCICTLFAFHSHLQCPRFNTWQLCVSCSAAVSDKLWVDVRGGADTALPVVQRYTQTHKHTDLYMRAHAGRLFHPWGTSLQALLCERDEIIVGQTMGGWSKGFHSFFLNRWISVSVSASFSSSFDSPWLWIWYLE